jgi:hypothetical protein
MFSPPPGYDDLVADAKNWPITGQIEDIEVPRIGAVKARQPMPRSAAALSMTSNKKLNSEQQRDHLSMFLTDQLGEGEYERLLTGMIQGELPADTIQRVSRTIATWGTARPYTAVVTLSLFTGHHWRNIRCRLADAGIPNPLALPSLHSILDITEDIVVDSLYRSGQKDDGPPSPGELKVRQFYDAIYAPEPKDDDDDTATADRAVPAGFENPEDVESDFDAFLRATHH